MYGILLSRHSYNIVFFYQILLNITDIDSHMTNRNIFDLSVQSSIFFFFFFFWFCRMYHLLNVFLSRINMVLFQGFFLWANGFLHHKLTKKCDSHFSVDLKQISEINGIKIMLLLKYHLIKLLVFYLVSGYLFFYYQHAPLHYCLHK